MVLNMGFYHFVIGIGTIIFIGMLWTAFAFVIETATDIFIDITPATIGNYTVNVSAVTREYEYGRSTMYFFMFFITFVILIWIYKSTVEEQAQYPYG